MNGPIQVAASVLELARKKNFAGYDPFDGLNSKLFDLIPGLKLGIIGLAWIQFFKLSPINMRFLLAVPESRNPKGIGLFILGLLEDFKRTQNRTYLNIAIELADWLLGQQCSRDEWKHACWGYHFDWKARAFFVPKGKPNVITTTYVARALFALAEVLQIENPVMADRYRQVALDAADFITGILYTENDGRNFFAYIPGEIAFVHNASLWAAAWVAVVAAYKENIEYRELALKVARQSVSEQAENGSWVYGARHHHQFIDGFHTGYNLEALNLIRKSLAVDEFDDSIKKGFSYYKANFFELDGTAKYYSNNRYPVDMHSVAQAVITLLKLSGEDGNAIHDMQLVQKVIARSLQTLYLPNKRRFLYQQTRRYSNKINYMRWTQAWVYYSFALFNRTQDGLNETD